MAAAARGSVLGGGYGNYCGVGGSNVGVSFSMSAASLSPPLSTCLQQQQLKALDGRGGFFTSAVAGSSSSTPFFGASMVSFDPVRAGSKRTAATTDLINLPNNNSFGPYIPAANTDRWLDDTAEFLGGDEDDLDEYFHLHPSSSSKKRRLTSDQVRFLERSFEVENKLEPERKVRLAKDLGMQPRQVAVWFQNRRARWKNKRLEKDFESLKSRFCKLKGEFESLVREKDQLEAQVVQLSGKLHGKGTVKLLADDDDQHQHEAAAGDYFRESDTSDSDNRFRTSSTDPAVAAVAVDTSSASEAESTSWQQQQQQQQPSSSMTFLISQDHDLAAAVFETSAPAESPLSYVVDHCSHHLAVADFQSHDHTAMATNHCYAAAFKRADGSDVSDGFNDGFGGFDSSQFGVRAVVVAEDNADEEDDNRPPWIWSY